jgi:hypothetical protein
MSGRKLIAHDPDRKAGEQIKKSCSDCPWRRDALNGWLGGNTAQEWLIFAHSETQVPCHVYSDVQCAGIAIYRANVSKRPVNRALLVLPPDEVTVFASPREFLEHHEATPERRLRDAQARKKSR